MHPAVEEVACSLVAQRLSIMRKSELLRQCKAPESDEAMAADMASERTGNICLHAC